MTKDNFQPASRSWLWLWFVAAFVVQGAVWALWFVIASHHKVETVPLVVAPLPK